MNPLTFIIYIGITLGCFLGALLLTLERGNKTANRLLGFILLFSAASISGIAILNSRLILIFPHILGVPTILISLLGPLFYLFAGALLGHYQSLSPRQYFHFLPFGLLIIALIPFLIQSGETKLLIASTFLYLILQSIVLGILTIHLFVYLFFTIKLIKNYSLKIKDIAAPNEKFKLRWLHIWIYSFLAVFGFMMLLICALLLGLGVDPVAWDIVAASISVSVVITGFVGLKQPIIFPPEKDIERMKKYEKSTLTEEQANENIKKLLYIMETEKLYLNSELTLLKLADRLSILPNHLSQMLNEKLNKNFFDFVNAYRVEEAKRMLLDERGTLLTILAIAGESGFNSKSSFNSVFKKYTGKTPTQYKLEMRQTKNLN